MYMWQTILYAIIGRPTERHSNRTKKAKKEMTHHQQQAEALFEEFMGKPDDDTLGTEYVRKDITIAFAAFCLEKNGWKKYPDEKPENIGEYLVIINDGDDYKPSLLRKINDNHVWSRAVIAFMPIPEYKP